MQRILVTGAAGFIGSHSVECLLERGCRVVGVDNLRTGRLENLAGARRSPHFEWVEADASDPEAMGALFARHRFDGVVHLAALVSVPESFREPELNYRSNLAATDLLARLCVEQDCRRFVFASSAAVYGDSARLPNREADAPEPRSPYAAAKLASEIMLLGYAASYGLEAVCFRYFNVYGQRQDPGSPYSGVLSIFTDRFRAGQAVSVFGDGEQTRDFVSVKDVARFNSHAATAAGVANGRYNVCTGAAVSLNQVLAIYRELHPACPAPTYGPARSGDIRHSLGDPARAAEVLGLEARVAFDEGLRALIEDREPAASDEPLGA